MIMSTDSTSKKQVTDNELERRRQINREAAARARRRQKDVQVELKKKVLDLESTQTSILYENITLKKNLVDLKNAIKQHVCVPCPRCQAELKGLKRTNVQSPRCEPLVSLEPEVYNTSKTSSPVSNNGVKTRAQRALSEPAYINQLHDEFGEQRIESSTLENTYNKSKVILAKPGVPIAKGSRDNNGSSGTVGPSDDDAANFKIPSGTPYIQNTGTLSRKRKSSDVSMGSPDKRKHNSSHQKKPHVQGKCYALTKKGHDLINHQRSPALPCFNSTFSTSSLPSPGPISNEFTTITSLQSSPHSTPTFLPSVAAVPATVATYTSTDEPSVGTSPPHAANCPESAPVQPMAEADLLSDPFPASAAVQQQQQQHVYHVYQETAEVNPHRLPAVLPHGVDDDEMVLTQISSTEDAEVVYLVVSEEGAPEFTPVTYAAL